MAEALGLPPMPWQQHWMLVTGELIRDEESGLWIPAYPEAFATVMRQNGKTLWVLAAELQRATLWEAYDGKPQAIAYSGQSGSMARQKFRKEHWPQIHHSPMNAAVSRPRFAAEDTGLDFHNGSILTIWSSSEDAGHSLTVDLACLDEIWADVDDRREQAAIPAMATRHDRQKLLASTGGTDRSALYLQKQAAGRDAVVAAKTSGMAYVEFAFDPDDDPEDPRTWWKSMPALGHTIYERTVQAALDEMRGPDGDLSEFMRAWGNVTKRTGGGRVIPEEMWLRACTHNEAARPEGRLLFGVDANPDQTAAAIAVCDDQGRAELVDYRKGTRWCADRLAELVSTHGGSVAVDISGPMGSISAELQRRGVKVHELSVRQMTHACAEFTTRLADGELAVYLTDPDTQAWLDTAVADAQKRRVGDAWLWGRRSVEVDICPLVALTIAAGRQAEEPDYWSMVY